MKDSALPVTTALESRWTPERAWAWHDALPWLRGCNFVPSSAVNQLEMWQPDTFDLAGIDRELGWLAGLGMNSMRVFLHDLLWPQDAKGFLARLEQFLEVAERHGIGIMFVFFDSCWHPFPELGPQREPTPGVHNSYWVQSPGLPVLRNEREWSRLEDYVGGVVTHFRDDRRVHVWDVWNEPHNAGTAGETPGNVTADEKSDLVLPLLERAFRWVRAARPSQPLTSGIWRPEDWSDEGLRGPITNLQLESSDVISFHTYVPLEETRARCDLLRKWGRPLLCTEYMARGAGSTFQEIMPYFQREKIAAYNWGAVSGKTQTIYPWDSCQKPYTAEPVPWHHDIFRPDGAPYDPAETELIKSLR